MSDNIWVQESFVNQTEGYRFGDSEVYETYTDDRGRLFKDMQREYGRCVSKVYIDGPIVRAEHPERSGNRQPIQVGWIFEKRMKYEDDPDKSYVREVWVTLHKAPPTVTTRYNYNIINV